MVFPRHQQYYIGSAPPPPGFVTFKLQWQRAGTAMLVGRAGTRARALQSPEVPNWERSYCKCLPFQFFTFVKGRKYNRKLKIYNHIEWLKKSETLGEEQPVCPAQDAIL